MIMIPQEIITEILTRLPARELRRLRYVSQLWRSLIDSPYFINMHLNHSIQNNSNRTLILSNGIEIFFLHIHDIFEQNHNRKLNSPLKISRNYLLVFGSCNGLLLLGKKNTITEYNYLSCCGDCLCDVGILNPNTGEYKGLPDLPQHDEFSSSTPYYAYHVYGFGFDSSRDDYKVVSMTYFVDLNESKRRSECNIYSLKSNSWRQNKCAALPLNLSSLNISGGVFVSGALHWTGALTNKGLVILAFDIGSEKFQVIAHPDSSIKRNWITMEELSGKLCLSSIREDYFIDLWIMKEYGVKESWMKLLSISSSPVEMGCWWLRQGRVLNAPFARPLTYLNSGNKILLNQRDGNFILYDLANGTNEEVNIQVMDGSFVAFSCVDSLVRLSDYDINCYQVAR